LAAQHAEVGPGQESGSIPTGSAGGLSGGDTRATLDVLLGSGGFFFGPLAPEDGGEGTG